MDDRSRRRYCQTVAGVMSLGVAGCLDTIGHDDSNEEQSSTDDKSPDVDLSEDSLDTSFPIELVEPDADLGSGYTRSDLIATVHGHVDFNHWHFEPLEIPCGGDRTVRVRFFVDDPIRVVPLGPDEDYRVGVSLTHPSETEELAADVDADLVTISGRAPDDDDRPDDESIPVGEVRFELYENDAETDTDSEPYWRTPPLEVHCVDGESG